MIHGISEQEWEDYLESQLPAERREQIESHLLGCLACWERYQEMKRTSDQLKEAGAAVRNSLPLSDRQLYVGLRGVFARIRASRGNDSSAARSPIQERLDYLESVLAVMCGLNTAARALQVAARSSPARSLHEVTPDNWELFLKNLTCLATVMCGETGAHLVRRSGQF